MNGKGYCDGLGKSRTKTSLASSSLAATSKAVQPGPPESSHKKMGELRAQPSMLVVGCWLLVVSPIRRRPKTSTGIAQRIEAIFCA